jgi:hypothetical protein
VLLDPSFSLPVLSISDDTALQADRPPDEDGEEDLERPVRRHRTSTPDVDAAPVDSPVVVLSDQVEERGRRCVSWNRVKRRLRSAFDLLRALFFVEVQDERVCLRLRGFIQPRVRQWSMSWRALWRTLRLVGTTPDTALAELQACLPAWLDENLDKPRLEGVLVGLLVLTLRGAVDEYYPLFDKLTPERQRTMERLLGVEFADELSRRRALFDLPDVRTWFSLRVRAAHRPLDRSIDDLFAFPHVQDWVTDELGHASKREAFEMKAERARETSELTVRRNALKKERAECQELLAWSEEDEEAFEAALEEIKTRTTAARSSCLSLV